MTRVDYDGDDLLAIRTVNALGNAVAVENDYRVLQPSLLIDPNRNRAAAAFDALGLVVATAVMGKPGENVGDLLEGFEADLTAAEVQAFAAAPETQAAGLLGKATTRLVYDVDRYMRAGQPPFAAALAREVHFHDAGGPSARVLVSFAYSDGFAREIQRKVQAEPGEAPQRAADVALLSGDIRPGELVRDAQGRLVRGPVPLRWVGTGRIVYNNKGSPVQEYEPFFSATHLYEPERDMTDTGVSPVRFYDPVEREIVTLLSNHSYTKVVFDGWQQVDYDANDTVLLDPRTDPDVAGYVRAYFAAEPPSWQTWHAERSGGALGPAEQDAAQKAAAHADTPMTGHLDVLGRPFVTVTDNAPDPAQPAHHVLLISRIEMDIEGNRRAVFDFASRLAMRYDYDMLGTPLHRASMESGERWTLADATGNPLRAWDGRGYERRLSYDPLRRLTGLFVSENGIERLAERTVYGEAQGDAGNHRTRVHQLFDGAGVITSVAYDFKGNLAEGRRDILPGYKDAVDWLQNPPADGGTFTSHTAFDALNRVQATVSPDGSIYRPVFNEANLLNTVDVALRGQQAGGQPVFTPFVTNIDYNAKGQRVRIAYDGGTITEYTYDPLTFRLGRLVTRRPANPDVTASALFVDPSVVQDLRYTYDPAGNITRLEDAAVQTVFHNGQQVEPVASYTYDALYRLVEAKGREHITQAGFDFNPPSGDARDFPFAGNHAAPNDLQALRNYVEQYAYDAAGNFETVRHTANGGSWTRSYDYAEPSLLEPGKNNNQLSRTRTGNGVNHTETYAYATGAGPGALEGGAHGAITALNGRTLAWDFEDQLQAVDLGGGGTAYYVYDGGGQRARKVIESHNGTRRKECLFLGGFEVYREFAGNGTTVTLERQTLHVLDDKSRLALVDTLTVDNSAPVSAAPLLRYQIGDHLGSARVELDAASTLISYEEYHPYGTTSFQAGRSAAEVSTKRYRYTRMERDEETGMSYHSARYYVPWLGRWLSADPAGLDGGMNLYAYAHDSPTSLVDRGGAQPSLTEEYELGWTYKSMPNILFYQLAPGQYAYTTDRKTFYQIDNKTVSIMINHGHPILIRNDEAVYEVPAHLLSDNPGELSSAGTRWNAQGPRQFYQNPKALDLAMAGYWKEADIWEAGHGCAGCHIERITNGPVPNEMLDLNRYNRVALLTKVAADVIGARYDPRNPFTLVGIGIHHATAPIPSAPRPAPAVPAPRLGPSAPAQLSALETITAMEQHVAAQNARVAQAITNRERTFFQQLGMSEKQIDILMNPRHRTFAAQYGNAMERAVGRAFAQDARLSGIIVDTRNAGGVVFPKRPPGQGRDLRPDWGIQGGELKGNIVDLTTRGGAAKKQLKYHDRVITLEYDRPSFRSN